MVQYKTTKVVLKGRDLQLGVNNDHSPRPEISRIKTPGSNSTGASLLGASHRMKPYVLAPVENFILL